MLVNIKAPINEINNSLYALTELVNEITASLDSKMHTMGVFIDFKKAFDTVDHKLLCEKIWFYGIRGVAHNWIRSY